jgi:hypothetical protein
MGKTPDTTRMNTPYNGCAMPIKFRTKSAALGFRNAPLTFGAFVAGGYSAWGKRKAKGIIHLVIKTHMIEFCGQERFRIS